MRKLFKIAIAAASIVALAAVLSPAQASCGAPYQISTIDVAGNRTYVWTEDVFNFYGWYYGVPYSYDFTRPVTGAFDAVFWSYGVGAGNNNGTFDVTQWFLNPFNPVYDIPSIGFYAAGEVFTTWAASSAITGCLAAGGINPTGFDGQECTCLLMTDQNGATGYYAAVGNGVDASGNTFFVQPGDDGGGNGAPIILKPIPKPTITGSFRDPGTFNITLDVNVTGAPGDYLGDVGAACNCGVTGYKVLARTLTRGSAPPADRNADGWLALDLAGGAPQGVNPLGAPITVESLCGASNVDVYLATQLFFDSNYSTSVVSANSTRVECGPTIAEPQPIRPKVRPDNPELRRNDRGARGR